MDFTFRPITTWPGKLRRQSERRRSPFGVTYNKMFALLAHELIHLRASGVTIQLALNESEIRLDGKPRAGASPAHPGVILTFAKPGRKGETPPTLNFPCDSYTEWTANLRAISLALEALRAVDRYGVTQNAEQYRGWSALPPPGGLVTPPPLTVEDAARVVVGRGNSVYHPDSIVCDYDTYREAYRAKAAEVHPDANGGQQLEGWNRLQQAKAVLDRHYGVQAS